MDKSNLTQATNQPPLDPPSADQQETGAGTAQKTEEPNTFVNEKPLNVPIPPMPPEKLESGLSPEETMVRQGRIIAKQKEEIADLKERARKYAYAPDTRKFRIYINILQGAAARGVFDPDTVKKSGGPEYVVRQCLHFANISEHAQQVSEGKF